MSIKTYAFDANVQLSPHFNSNEFRCKCGKNHDLMIDDDLIIKLEQLYDKLGCCSITINSGFRCIEHDKKVGGNRRGMHTMGKAADIVCKQVVSNNRLIIGSPLVCCAAQDIGFGGIANINASRTSTHVDVRVGSKYYGDEVRGTSSVTKDFYDYFNIPRENEKDDNVVISKEQLKTILDSLKESETNIHGAIEFIESMLSK